MESINLESRIWQPDVIENVSKDEVDLYFKFAQSACIPGGSNSESLDEALHQLYLANGDTKLAIQQLLKQPTVVKSEPGTIPQSQTVANTTTTRNISRHWTREEVDQFERLISHHGKNFDQISSNLKSKSVAQCVDFYYIWKRSPLRNLSRLANRRYQLHQQQHQSQQQQFQPQQPNQNQLNSSTISHQSNDLNNNGLMVVLTPNTANHTIFTCKVCGREFEKIKSRSAHMKRHKNGR